MKLLKPFVSLIVILILAPTLSAQRYFSPRFEIGVKSGVALSNQQISPSIQQKMPMGFMGGVVVRYSEEKLFGIMAELMIDQRGWEEDFEGAPFSYKRQLTYIDLPIMTHINFGGKKFRGFVNLGPSVGYLISDGISANFDYNDPSKVEGFPIDDRHINQMSMEIKNKFDYGIVGGVGAEFRVKRRHSIMIEARYYFGLGNIFSSSKKDEFSASRGTAIQVGLSYLFRIK